MSDDPATLASTATPDQSSANVNAAVVADSNNAEGSSAGAAISPAQRRARERVVEQTVKRAEWVGDIMDNLDILVYAQLCVVYYMDNSCFRLLLRSITQMFFLTPKGVTNPPQPVIPPYLPIILVSNLICLLAHIFFTLSAGSEMARGYLHGSVITDFVGEKSIPGFHGHMRLVLLDFTILALQVIMSSVKLEEQRLQAIVKNAGKEVQAEGVPPVAAGVPGQDHDSEERGVLREAVGHTTDDIEMQDLGGRAAEDDDTHDEAETDRLLEEAVGSAGVEPSEGHLDVFYSGNLIVADFHILHTLRNYNAGHTEVGANALQAVGHSTAYEWTRMQQRLSRMQP